MSIKFEKWQGLGNDFIILFDDIATSDLAIRLCDRNFGIGADGIFCPTKSVSADIGWKFFNSDGTIAQMCGNGIRCFAQFVKKHNIVSKDTFTVETLAGIKTPEIIDNKKVRVNMGTPVFDKNIEIEGYKAFLVSMGNPHCVIFTEDNTENLAKTKGKVIENNPVFPEKTNVEFANIISNNRIKMNVWERGCGITLACGTGACATVAAGVKNGFISNICDVVLPGGILNIDYSKENIFMTGDAVCVFSGEYLE